MNQALLFFGLCGSTHSTLINNQGMERVQFSMEYLFRASPSILYKFFTTPACLVRWFCDEVDIQGSIFTFFWSGSDEMAEVIDDVEDERIRFLHRLPGVGIDPPRGTTAPRVVQRLQYTSGPSPPSVTAVNTPLGLGWPQGSSSEQLGPPETRGALTRLHEGQKAAWSAQEMTDSPS